MTKTITTITFAMIAITSLMFAAPSAMTPAQAGVLAVGDAIQTTTMPTTAFCSVGLAVDDQAVPRGYIDECSSPVIQQVDLATGASLDSRNFAAEIPELPNAMAYDSTRGGNWICTQSQDGNGDMPIYFQNFQGTFGSMADDTVTQEFVVTGVDFTFHFCDGLAINLNGPGAADDRIYFSDDVNNVTEIYDVSGTHLATIDNTLVDGSLVTGSGLAVGGNVLYMGNNGGGDVFRADLLNTPVQPALIDQFVSGDERQEDMECDAITFAPIDVVWVRTTPQGGLFPNVITAYVIEEDSCIGGGGAPTIEKFYTHTNNNWDLVCDTPDSVLVGEECVLPDGTIVDPPRPANINTENVFAEPLDQNGADQYVLLGKETTKKTVVTPGQYIAVSNVFVPVEQDVTVEEDFDDCNDEIGDVNPRKAPGGVQVVLVLENGDVLDIDDDLAAGIGGYITLEDDKATVHVEDVPAGSELRVMLKFAPYDDPGMIGLECTNYERLLDDSGAVFAEASADLIIEEK